MVIKHRKKNNLIKPKQEEPVIPVLPIKEEKPVVKPARRKFEEEISDDIKEILEGED